MKKKTITRKTKIKANDVVVYDSPYNDQTIVSLKVSKCLYTAHYTAHLDSYDLDTEISYYFDKKMIRLVDKCFPKEGDTFVVLDVHDTIRISEYDCDVLKCVFVDNLDSETIKEIERDSERLVKIYSIVSSDCKVSYVEQDNFMIHFKLIA